MSNVINKKDLAEKLAEEFGCSKKDATAYVQLQASLLNLKLAKL